VGRGCFVFFGLGFGASYLVSTIRGAGVRCLIRSGIRGEVFGEQHEGGGGVC
jgi:hypothetical protein